MNKSAIQKFAVQARTDLIAQVKQQAYNYGIDANSFGDKDAEIVNGTALSKDKVKQRRKLIDEIQRDGYEQVMERVAYTWFNRFIALRFMEVNDYLPSHIRVFSNDKGEFKPEILTNALSLELDGLDKEKVMELLDNPQGSEDLYRYLFLTQCNELHRILPEMFEKVGGYKELLLPLKILSDDSVIAHMVNDISEDDWNIDYSHDMNNISEVSGQMEILGWFYQYYIAEPKDKLINARSKYKADDVPFVTQIFTSDWIVEYIVDNSLGKYWIERNPESNLNNTLKFYVAPQKGENKVYPTVNPETITFLDPCMGSGHMLIYAFDVFMQIYKECGYSEREAARLIIEKNLHGLDIDERAYQIAHFSIMMKARSYDRRFFTRETTPKVYYPKIDSACKEIGSLLLVDELEAKPTVPEEVTLFNLDYEDKINDWNFKELLSKKYTIICTNPPYMNASYMPVDLKKYVEKEYKDYKSDLFSAFMAREIELCIDGGYVGMLTPYVWMFISSYEKMRNFILCNAHISTLVQLEFNAFEGACVPVCAFVFEKTQANKYGEYIRLSDFKGIEIQAPKTLEAIQNTECGYRFSSTQSNYFKIPSTPIAYWASDNMIKMFSHQKLGDIAKPRQGMATSDNKRFLRAWYEVDDRKIFFNAHNIEEARVSKSKWFPYNKGGGFRKWYGNNEFLVNWENDGFEIKQFATDLYGSVTRTIKNIQFYFQDSITWTFIAITPGFRYCDFGFAFDVAGSSIFISNDIKLYTLGFLCCNVSSKMLSILNPTMNLQANDIKSLPLVIKENQKTNVEALVNNNIFVSKTDWDSFETSWDFVKHPFIANKDFAEEHHQGEDFSLATKLEDAYAMWQAQTIRQFEQLKANEEELNRIFIDIYGLQDELTPEVEDKDVTVRTAKLDTDVKSFISYAVGCMFGRYSLDVDGLAYAGGEFDNSKYTTFAPDSDNVIPICDDEYFEDDIVGRFVDFVKVVYGGLTLEQNLQFIADALGGKGTPREVIRNYFVKDFFNDHVKTYSKRPIYWQFDSGKKNGFKALIYMHRYESDLLARIRTDYVHEQQERYRTQMASLEENMVSATPAERTKMTKAHKKLQEQALEIQKYEEKIHHLADQNISIDLDDGVVKNYAIFSDVVSKIK